MRETFRNDIPRRLSLQRVIADLVCSLERFFDVAAFQNVVASLRVMGPNPRKIISLQFQTDRCSIGCELVSLPPNLGDLLTVTQQVLDVMCHLMGNHVGLREISRSVVTPLELFKERRRHVNLLISWTVKRSHRRVGRSACRPDRIRKQDQLWGTVGLIEVSREEPLPYGLCIVQNDRYELADVVIRRGLPSRNLLLLLPLFSRCVKERLWIRPEEHCDGRNDHDTDSTTSHHNSALTSTVLHVFTSRSTFPTHDNLQYFLALCGDSKRTANWNCKRFSIHFRASESRPTDLYQPETKLQVQSTRAAFGTSSGGDPSPPPDAVREPPPP